MCGFQAGKILLHYKELHYSVISRFLIWGLILVSRSCHRKYSHIDSPSFLCVCLGVYIFFKNKLYKIRSHFEWVSTYEPRMFLVAQLPGFVSLIPTAGNCDCEASLNVRRASHREWYRPHWRSVPETKASSQSIRTCGEQFPQIVRTLMQSYFHYFAWAM